MWPKSCQKNEREIINTHLLHPLKGLKRCVARKLEKMGDTTYRYEAERYGVKVKRKNRGQRRRSKDLGRIEYSKEKQRRGPQRGKGKDSAGRSKAGPDNAVKNLPCSSKASLPRRRAGSLEYL